MKDRLYMSPSRLTAAREFRGLTKKALAEGINVKPMTVSGYENGDWQPACEVLQEIANYLRFPLSWFLLDDVNLVDSTAPTFRGQSRMTARTRHQAARTWDLAALITKQMHEQYSLPKPSIPDLSLETPESAAIQLRDEWKLGNEPIQNLVHLLESKGVAIYWTDIQSETVDACCHWFDRYPIMLLNLWESAGERLRFNAAHELGHLVLHRDRDLYVSALDSDEETESFIEDVPSKIREIQANRFASAFLMPAGAWSINSPLQPNLDAFLNLKPLWKVSVQAMIRRSFDLQLITEWQYESAMKRISINNWRKSEPGTIPVEESLLHRKVFDLLVSSDLSVEGFAASLSLPLEDLQVLMPIARQYKGAMKPLNQDSIGRGGTLRMVAG